MLLCDKPKRVLGMSCKHTIQGVSNSCDIPRFVFWVKANIKLCINECLKV